MRRQIRERDDPFAGNGAFSQSARRGGHAPCQVGAEIGRARVLQDVANGDAIERRSRQWRGVPGAKRNGGRFIGAEPLERGERLVAGAREESLRSLAVAHGQRRVDDERGRLRTARHRRLSATRLQRRPRQRECHAGDEQATQREQQDLPQSQAPYAALLRAQHELDGAELERPRTTPIEEVHEDGQRERQQAP
jgi:hypothetical protein